MADVASPPPIRALPRQLDAATNTTSVNSCRVKVDANGCAEKRTCRDCLSASLLSNEGLQCYLDATSGLCNAFEELSDTVRTSVRSLPNGTTQWTALANQSVFASLDQRYCRFNDPACSLCKAMADMRGYAPSTNQLKKMSSDRNICYGTNNCICVATCESREWVQNAGNRCTTSSLPSYSTPSPQSRDTQSKLLTYIGVFVLLQFSFAAMLVIRKRRQLIRMRQANGPYNNPGILDAANRLQLPGWSAWQQQLRDNERKGDTAFVNLDVLRPSTLALTTASESSDASTASPAIMSPTSIFSPRPLDRGNS